MAVPIQLEIFMKDLTRAGLQSVGKNVDDVENQTLQLIAALEKVRAEQIKQLEANKQAGADYAKEAANVQALTGQINGLKSGLKDLQKTKEETARPQAIDIDTDAVTRKTNNLKMQFSQVARELPSLAMGPQMFILAISNNLPMLADAIADVRKQNELLAASGKKGVPVWKQLASSVFSWQTALVAAISLGIVFGKDIMDWVKNLGKANKELSETQKLQQAVNTSHREGGKAASEESAKLKILYTASQDSSKSMKERNKAVDELQKMYPSYFGKLTNEAILAGKAASAYDDLTKAIIRKGQAQAAEDIVADYSKQNFQLQRNINEDTNWTNRNKAEYEKALKEREKMWENYRKVNQGSIIVDSAAKAWISNTPEGKLIEEYERRMSNIKKYTDQIAKNNKIIEGTVKQIDTSAYIDDGLDGNYSKSTNEKTDYASQLADARVKAQQTTEKLRLQIMLEGIAKRKALAKQEYDDSIADIDKQERDTLAKMDKARKQGDNIPQNQYDDVKNTANTNRLLAKEIYNKKLLQIDNDYYSQAEKDMLEYDKKYGSYQDKQLAIIKEYYNKIAEATTDGRKKYLQKELEGLLLELQKEEKKAALTQDNNFLKMLFGDVSQMAFSDLSNLIAQARQLRDYLSGNGDKNGITFISTEQLKAIEESPEELDKLKKALDKLLDSGKKSHLEEIFDTFRKGFADLQSAKGFKDISGAIGTISGAAGDAAGMISEMFDAMGNTAVADALGEVQQVMNAVSNIGQGFAKGGIVGGIAAAIGEAANFIGQAFSANQRHKEALKQVMNEAIAQQREYNLLLMQQNLLYEEATTIFGTDSYAKAANSVNVMKDAISELNEALKGTSEQQEKQNTKPILGRMLNGVTGYYSELKSLYAGLADVDIKTGHKKTGLFGWGKGKDIYSSILDVYPDLIDANGDFNKELAETIINTREMSDEDKAALQNMIDLAEQAEEAYESLNDYMTDIFGELGGSMSDALVDAFKNGTDAASAFADSVSDMLETLAEQMVYSVTLAPIMEEAQSAMLDVMRDTSLTDKQKYEQWTNILNGLVSDATEQQQIANNLYEAYQNAAKEQGFDIFKPDNTGIEQSPSSGALTTMSQDSISAFEGIGRNMQTHLANVDRFVQELRETQKLDSETLATIASHTAYIVLIYDLMEDMKLNGIKMQ